MDRSQRELRRAAAQAFMESLDQLGMGLAEASNTTDLAGATNQDQSLSQAKDYEKELEEAAADIEQFIQSR